MALSFVMAVTNFDSRTMNVIRRRLQLIDFGRFNFLNLEPPISPTLSEVPSGYGSLDSPAISTSTNSPKESPSGSLKGSPKRLPKGSPKGSQKGSPKEAKESSEDDPEDSPEDSLGSGTTSLISTMHKDISQESPPLRVMHEGRDILNLGANLREPTWHNWNPRNHKYDEEKEGLKRNSVYFRLNSKGEEALTEDYPVNFCPHTGCEFTQPSHFLFPDTCMCCKPSAILPLFGKHVTIKATQ
ncbi:uncharacterized protein LOC117167629 [Belonocnema kinseyi]|uniref:uncharacterized protein LOC117167629 n=1 Tax=Belonocnema kinseyi TaxID=2817044 RepID=UPI00143D80D3|nr:uncharacterized protein LOC117167629 [Belonocnema kinseyi]